jgi:Protein of unknown function (DUF2934)
MTSEKSKSTSVTPISDPQPNLDEAIRCRAYQLYEERGRKDGHDMDDWLRAEAEVTRDAARTIVAA